ncbi:MAG: type II toxin-antitoxin system RelE/ParE family toxin [Alphaproteobacteria bacterium]|nr:type II toxin-antitoxin system RelE/ParE family toxin [Alphaproteobacteria bacterium]
MSAMIRAVHWVGSSKKDFKQFPADVQDRMGYALFRVQAGKHPHNAKPLKGFDGGSVLAIAEDWKGETYRTIYTVRFEDEVYVLHAFQKKSKKGIATMKADIDLVRQRLRSAEIDHRRRRGGNP